MNLVFTRSEIKFLKRIVENDSYLLKMNGSLSYARYRNGDMCIIYINKDEIEIKKIKDSSIKKESIKEFINYIKNY